MEKEILSLSASSKLPVPLERQLKGTRLQSDEKENGNEAHELQSTNRIAAANGSHEAVAPYQALPVIGRTITEHLTPPLPVLNAEEFTQEVIQRIILMK